VTHYSKIQGWFEAHDLYDFLVDQAPYNQTFRFIELGCWKGKSTAYLAQKIVNSGKNIELFAVDTFRGSDEAAHHKEPELHRLFDIFTTNMNEWVRQGLKLTIHTGTLASFANAVKPAHFDAVFLDGSHDYIDVKQDIQVAKRLLKSGGWICGDDLPWEGVARAVEELVPDAETGGGKWRWWRKKI